MANEQPENIRGRVLVDEPMSRHTSWRVGGPARRYFIPADREDLSSFLAQLPQDEVLYWLGLGSNLLVRDGGLDATVIAHAGALNRLHWLWPLQLWVEVGVALPKLARACAEAGAAGLGFLVGIPGSLGGALAMNAGAHGQETWDALVAVETIDRQGRLRVRPRSDFEVGYRHVRPLWEGEPEWFVAAQFNLKAEAPEQLSAELSQHLQRRAAAQPGGGYNSGSVFRNPPGDYAGRLIEACGLKGQRIGGAQVSDKHANFIINTGGASAADIEQLIEWVQAQVLETQGVALQREVEIVGEASTHE